MTTAERYQSVSAQLFEQAHLELEAGDLIQASEKFWGATAQSLKAIAHERAWEHKSHANFYRIIRNLVNETDDKDLVFLFQVADALHANFYEHWLEIDEIEKLADQVRDLLARLDNIQNS